MNLACTKKDSSAVGGAAFPVYPESNLSSGQWRGVNGLRSGLMQEQRALTKTKDLSNFSRNLRPGEQSAE